jgi:hypothetical protein
LGVIGDEQQISGRLKKLTRCCAEEIHAGHLSQLFSAKCREYPCAIKHDGGSTDRNQRGQRRKRNLACRNLTRKLTSNHEEFTLHCGTPWLGYLSQRPQCINERGGTHSVTKGITP